MRMFNMVSIVCNMVLILLNIVFNIVLHDLRWFTFSMNLWDIMGIAPPIIEIHGASNQPFHEYVAADIHGK